MSTTGAFSIDQVCQHDLCSEKECIHEYAAHGTCRAGLRANTSHCIQE